MFSRTRYLDKRSLNSASYQAEAYEKQGGCSQPLSWWTYASGPYTYSTGEYAYMSDFVVPGFRKKVSDGLVFMNPMSRISCSLDAGSGSAICGTREDAVSCVGSGYSTYQKQYRYTLKNDNGGRKTSNLSIPVAPDRGLLFPIGVVSAADIDSLIREVSTSVQAGRGKSQSNLWESLAEADAACASLPQLLQNLNRTLTGSLLARAKAAGSAYLVWRYGIKPILSDLENILKGLDKALGTVRSTTRNSQSLSASTVVVEPNDANYYGSILYRRQYAKSESVIVRAMSLDEHSASLQFNVGFSLKGLLTLPWELLPYSFVLDWFLNIGDLINSMVPAVGFVQLGSCYVVSQEISEVYSATNCRAISGLSLTSPLAGNHIRKWKIVRRCPGLPSPSLLIRNDFRLSNLTRAADALSLILQKVKV